MQKEINAMLKKAWWKKKSWIHEGPSIQRKKREKEIAHVQRMKMERDGSWKEFKHHPYKIKIFTLAHLDQGLWLVSPSDPIFDLATNEEQVCLRLFPDPKLHISHFRGRWKRRQHFTLVRNSKSKKRDLREQTEELSYVWFWKFIKPKYLSKGD